jgi:hypothetical protein
MHRIKVAEQIDRHRRLFFGAAAVTVAAAQLGMIDSAAAQTGGGKSAGNQARNKYVVRATEADRRRRPQCWLCAHQRAGSSAPVAG